MRLSLGPFSDAVRSRLESWRRHDFLSRLWRRDPSLWGLESDREVGDRLGWLELPRRMPERVPEIRALAREVREDGIRRVVLLGMGGSSLAPDVFQRTFGAAGDHPRLEVLDSTHPGAVRRMEAGGDPAATLFVVSSKSGTTIETTSLFHRAWAWTEAERPRPGKHFVAITDPGTPLAELAGKRSFRRLFEADTDVGGRYSALTHFGLVPAALIGADLDHLLAGAGEMARSALPERNPEEAPGLVLGAALGELALAGRDKLTFLTSPGLDSLPDWIEQLVAESTGKGGRGILPVVGEPALPPEQYGGDRVFVGQVLAGDGDEEVEARLRELEAREHPVVRLRLQEASELGAELYRWELATAAAGAVLEIHPFDQPDVELAKELAQEAMEGEPGAMSGEGEVPSVEVDGGREASRALEEALSGLRPNGYTALQAFLDPSPEVVGALDGLRRRLAESVPGTITAGFGPRFLHSTGQLHKGGPAGGRFLQLVDDPGEEVAVPGAGYSFGELIRAQALGDGRALAQRGRSVLRLELGADAAGGLRRLGELVPGA